MKFLLSILATFFAFQTLTFADIDATDFQASGILPNNWDQALEGKFNSNDENDVSFPKPTRGNGLEQFQDLVFNNLATIFRYILISVALLYIFIDLITLILGSSDESVITQIKGNMGYYALGLLLVGLSSEMVKIFDTAGLTEQVSGGGVEQIGNVEQAKTLVQYIINYISLFAGTIAVLFMLVAAIRMITARGDESIIDEEKKDFQYGFVGLIVIIFADVMINKVFYPEDIQAPGSTEVTTFAQEAFGLASFFLGFLAIIAIGFMVLAGGYYIMSYGDEEQTSKAKNILKNLAIGFIMITIAYTIVSAVAPGTAGQVIAQ